MVASGLAEEFCGPIFIIPFVSLIGIAASGLYWAGRHIRRHRSHANAGAGSLSDMGELCDHDRVLALFASRRADDRDEAIAAAVVDSHADVLLAGMLASATYSDNVAIAAQLGDLRGEAGTAALREAVNATGPRTRDLRCAALL